MNWRGLNGNKKCCPFSTNLLKDNSDITPLKIKDGETIENYKCVELTSGGIKNIKVIDAISNTLIENSDRGYSTIFDNGNGYYVSFYSDHSNNNYGTLSIYDTSDDIKLTNKIVFRNRSTSHHSVVKMSENIFLVSFSDEADAGKGYSMVIKLINNIYFGGTPFRFNGGRTHFISADALTPNTVAIMYKDVGSANRGNCMILRIEDTTITTIKTEVTVSNKVDTVTALYRETENTFTVIYDSIEEGVTLKELTYNGTTIITTYTDILNILDIDAYDDIRIDSKLFFISAIDSKVFLFNIDLDNVPATFTMFIYITDTAISTSDIITLTSDNIVTLDAISLTDSKAIVTYVYVENSIYKTKHILYEKNALPNNVMGIAIKPESSLYYRCAIGGVVSGFSDITIGANYFVSDNGGLVEVPQTLKDVVAIGIDHDRVLWLKPILK